MADLARIKGNVAKMAAQNAPEEDIDGYIASEGVTLDDVRNFRPQAAPAAPAAPDERNSVLGKVDAAVRGAADTLTFGFADEIAAGLGTGFGYLGNYDEELARQRGVDKADSENRFGYRLGGQLAGALGGPTMAAKSVAGAAGLGAAQGGAYGFGSGEGDAASRGQNAALGAFVGGAAGGALGLVGNAVARQVAGKTIPDIPALKAASNAGYKAAEAADVIVRPEGIQRLARETVQDLTEFGYHPQLQPKIGAVLNEMERLGTVNSSFKGLDTFRKIVGQVAGSNEPSERAMATRILGRLDDYMGNLPADDVITGNAAQASAGIQQGRDNWARMRRAEMVDTAAVKAQRRADTSGTGGNLDNALRQNVRQIMDNPRRSRGMSDLEKQLAEKIISGTTTQNVLRGVGRLSPATGGLSAQLNVIGAVANPLLAIPGVIGTGAKIAADKMTERNVARLSEAIRSGGMTADQVAALASRGIGKQEIIDAIMGVRQTQGRVSNAAAQLTPGLMQYAP